MAELFRLGSGSGDGGGGQIIIKPGPPGPPGLSAFDQWCRENLIIDTPDTHPQNWTAFLNAIRGPKGDKGEPGTPGIGTGNLPPNDDYIYGVQNGMWVRVLDDAPGSPTVPVVPPGGLGMPANDNYIYGVQNGVWVKLVVLAN